MGFDDEELAMHDLTNSSLSYHLLSNLLAHFSCSLALLLLETTDIEDFLKFDIRLSELSRYNVIFTYRE